MSEIKRDLIKLKEGVPYNPTNGDVVITDEHTLSDIFRFLLESAGGEKEEIQHLLDGVI